MLRVVLQTEIEAVAFKLVDREHVVAAFAQMGIFQLPSILAVAGEIGVAVGVVLIVGRCGWCFSTDILYRRVQIIDRGCAGKVHFQAEGVDQYDTLVFSSTIGVNGLTLHEDDRVLFRFRLPPSA